MPARKCLKCKDSYPADRGSAVRCPRCDEVLQYSSHGKPDTDWPPEIKEVLGPLDEESKNEILEDWNAVEKEARRRNERCGEPRWSSADIIAEGWRAA